MDGLRRFLGALVKGSVRGGNSLRSNAPLMLLSVGLATVLWVFVTNEENPSARLPLPFQISSFEPRNVPKGIVVTSQTPNDITVTLIGTKQAVNAVRTEDIQLYADLSGADASNSVGTGFSVISPVKASVRKRGVRAEVNPETVRVTLEPEVKRAVAIKVNTVDALPTGFELDTPPVADPPEATISGLKQNVDAVDAVYADLKLTGLSASTAVTLPLSARSSDGRAISGPTVQPATATVRVTVKRTLFPRDAYTAVQTHGKPAPGFTILGVSTDPATVTITGTLDVLNSISTIQTEDVEIEGATQDVKRVVALRLPPGVSAVNRPTVTATVSITASRGPGSVLAAPRIVGQAGGSAFALTSSVIVSFTGPLPQILALKPGDIQATVDVSNLAPGAYSLDPKITLPEGLTRDTVTPPKVDVVIAPPTPSATPAR